MYVYVYIRHKMKHTNKITLTNSVDISEVVLPLLVEKIILQVNAVFGVNWFIRLVTVKGVKIKRMI